MGENYRLRLAPHLLWINRAQNAAITYAHACSDRFASQAADLIGHWHDIGLSIPTMAPDLDDVIVELQPVNAKGTERLWSVIRKREIHCLVPDQDLAIAAAIKLAQGENRRAWHVINGYAPKLLSAD